MSREVTVISHGLIATAPLNIEKFVGLNWRFLLNERDNRSAELENVDFSRTNFVTCFKGCETRIRGEEKLFRLKEKTNLIRYGATVFMGLWIDYNNCLENSVLEQLYRVKKITYVDFFGDLLLSSKRGPYILGLYRGSDDTWRWLLRKLVRRWYARNLSAVRI